MSSTRSTKGNGGGNAAESRAETLKRMRELRESGATRFKDYAVTEGPEIFEKVTEEEFEAMARSRAAEDDFIIDDDGQGYADYGGLEDWDRAHRYSDGEDDDEDEADEDRTKSGKRKKGKKAKRDGRISTMLSKQAAAVAAASAIPGASINPKKKERLSKETNADSEQLLSSILNDIDEEAEKEIPVIVQKRVPSTPVQPRRPARPTPSYINCGGTRDAIRTPTQASPNDDNEAAVKVDDYETAADTDEAPVPNEESSQPAAQLPDTTQVKVKSITTVSASSSSSVKLASQKFIPKFVREEAKTATVVSALDNADCKTWKSVKKSLIVADDPASFTSSPGGTMRTGTGNFSTSSANDICEEDGSIDMFWFDAFEKGDSVYLFGKVLNKAQNKHVSCCLSVHGMERNLFVLPKDFDESGNPIPLSDVHSEFDVYRKKHGVSEFASKIVTRQYAFELDGMPAEHSYLKVVYPFTQPALPHDPSGRTFSHIFGTTSGPLELFILKRKLMGPCWIRISDPVFSTKSISWCKMEISVDSQKHVRVLEESQQKPVPPLIAMSLSLRTVMNETSRTNEIVAASALIYNVDIDNPNLQDQQPSHFTVIRQLQDIPLPVGFTDLLQSQQSKVEIQKNERGLLNFILANLHRHDPDIIVGHNFIDFDLDVLLHRMKANKLEHWSRLGRLRRKVWPKLQSGAGGTGDSSYAERQIACGRLLCDTYRAAQDLIRAKSYSLTYLASSQLQIERPNIEYEKIPTYFWDAKQLLEMIQHCEFDNFLAIQLMNKFQVLPLTKQLTCLAGNLWSRTMTGARAERNEYLLLHEFHNKKFIVPDKPLYAPKVIVDHQGDEEEMEVAAKPGRRKPAYSGGLVLEPKKGFYDHYVLLLDFNSLYPSIIQEYNICFTTVERNYGEVDVLPDVPNPDVPRGVLPKLLATLVDRRRMVKGLMKDPQTTPVLYAQYDIRQKALKLTANSMYGCLGFAHSRFFAKPLAMLITAKGREILQSTVDLALSQNLEVIYGDTDSVMIHTNLNDLQMVKRIGQDFKRAVNKRYTLLELEIDGFYQRLLLLKKKKYAALVVHEKNGGISTSLETKGLDLVRRDWCGLSHDVSSFALAHIFSGNQSKEEVLDKIHSFLVKVGEEVRAGMINIEKFVVNKGLTKSPEDYPDKKNQPHVQVALAMRKKGLLAKAGDTIPYVICEGPETAVASRAYHPDDVSKEGSGLKIDFEWYLSNQVHPPVARLCQPIEGTDGARLAECLGLNVAKYRASALSSQGALDTDDLFTLESTLSDEERFKTVIPWSPICVSCGTQSAFPPVLRMVDGDGHPVSSLECPHCRESMDVHSLVSQLMLAIRVHLRNYQNQWMICDDVACRTRTRKMSVYGHRCLVTGCKGMMQFEYPDTLLYTQLLYFQKLFDVVQYVESLKRKSSSDKKKTPEEINYEMNLAHQNIDEMGSLKAVANLYLERNSRRFVDLTQLFSFIR